MSVIDHQNCRPKMENAPLCTWGGVLEKKPENLDSKLKSMQSNYRHYSLFDKRLKKILYAVNGLQ